MSIKKKLATKLLNAGLNFYRNSLVKEATLVSDKAAAKLEGVVNQKKVIEHETKHLDKLRDEYRVVSLQADQLWAKTTAELRSLPTKFGA